MRVTPSRRRPLKVPSAALQGSLLGTKNGVPGCLLGPQLLGAHGSRSPALVTVGRRRANRYRPRPPHSARPAVRQTRMLVLRVRRLVGRSVVVRGPVQMAPPALGLPAHLVSAAPYLHERQFSAKRQHDVNKSSAEMAAPPPRPLKQARPQPTPDVASVRPRRKQQAVRPASLAMPKDGTGPFALHPAVP